MKKHIFTLLLATLLSGVAQAQMPFYYPYTDLDIMQFKASKHRDVFITFRPKSNYYTHFGKVYMNDSIYTYNAVGIYIKEIIPFNQASDAYVFAQRIYGFASYELFGSIVPINMPQCDIITRIAAHNTSVRYFPYGSVKGIANDTQDNLLVLFANDTLRKYTQNNILIWEKKLNAPNLKHIHCDDQSNIYLADTTQLIKLDNVGNQRYNRTMPRLEYKYYAGLLVPTLMTDDQHGGFYWATGGGFLHIDSVGTNDWNIPVALVGNMFKKDEYGNMVISNNNGPFTIFAPKYKYNYAGTLVSNYPNLNIPNNLKMDSKGNFYEAFGSFYATNFFAKYDTAGNFVGTAVTYVSQILGQGVPNVIDDRPYSYAQQFMGVTIPSMNAIQSLDLFPYNIRQSIPTITNLVVDSLVAGYCGFLLTLESTGLPNSVFPRVIQGAGTFTTTNPVGPPLQQNQIMLVPNDTLIVLEYYARNNYGTDTMQYTLHHTPLIRLAPPTITGSTLLCTGDSVVLTAPANGINLRWSNGATTPSITIKNNNVGDYWFLASNYPFDCYSKSQTVTIANDMPPKPSIMQQNNEMVCSTPILASWYINNVPVPNFLGNAIPIVQTGYYQAALQSASGCITRSDSLYTAIVSSNTTPSNQNKLIIHAPTPDASIISYDLWLSNPEMVHFVLFDAKGNVITKTQPEWLTVGKNSLHQNNQNIPQGVYFMGAYTSANKLIAWQKVVVL
jgi:hypothetical protein